MKKIKTILFLGVAISALLFGSCRKDYTCTCTSYVDGVEMGSASTTIENSTRAEASTACDAGDWSYGTSSVDCEIN